MLCVWYAKIQNVVIIDVKHYNDPEILFIIVQGLSNIIIKKYISTKFVSTVFNFCVVDMATNCLLLSKSNDRDSLFIFPRWISIFYWLNANRCSNFCALHTFARDLELRKPLQILKKQNCDDDRIFIRVWIELIMNECIQISALTFFCRIQLCS